MPLTTETLLAYSMGIIGTLLVLLISLVVYVFLTLREEVRGVSSDLYQPLTHPVRLGIPIRCAEKAALPFL